MGKLIGSSILMAALLLSGQTFAEDGATYRKRDPGVNHRQHHQKERIKQGIRSGELTREEARGLMAERHEIHKEEQQYRSDGVLTREERKDLHQDLNDLSKDIYQEKHDAEQRPK